MTEDQEYLVVENTGEVLAEQDTVTLVASEIQQEFIEIGRQGPPGPAGTPSIVSVGPNPPPNPVPGQEWIDTGGPSDPVEPRIRYTWVVDGDGGQWVEFTGRVTSVFAGGPLDMKDTAILNASTLGFNGEVNNGDSGALKTIVLAAGQKQRVRLTHDTPTLMIDGVNAGIGHYQLRILQDATGGRTPSFLGLSPTRWLGSATQPAVHAAPNGESVLSLYWDGAQFTQALAKVGAV